MKTYMIVLMIITNLLESILVYTLCGKILKKRTTSRKTFLIFTLVYNVWIFWSYLSVHNRYLKIYLYIVLVFVLIFALYKGRIFTRLFATLMASSTFMIGDVLTSAVVAIFLPLDAYIFLNASLLTALSGVSFYSLYLLLMTWIFRRLPLESIDTLGAHRIFYLIFTLTTTLAITAILSNSFATENHLQIATYLPIAIFFTLLNLFSIYSLHFLLKSQAFMRDAAVLKSQLDQFSTQFESLENTYVAYHSFRHDWGNHKMIMQGLVLMNDYKGLQEYISQLDGLLYKDQSVNSGNVIVDILVNNMYQKAKANDIAMDLSISLPEPLSIDKADLCVLISNALDNAMEACMKMQTGERKISFSMSIQHLFLHMTVENTYAIVPIEQDERLLTTKEDKELHGMGIRNMQSVAKKYKGRVTVSHNPTTFSLHCMVLRSTPADG